MLKHSTSWAASGGHETRGDVVAVTCMKVPAHKKVYANPVLDSAQDTINGVNPGQGFLLALRQRCEISVGHFEVCRGGHAYFVEVL